MEEAQTELQAYNQAYLQIFQAVLKKLPGEVSLKQQKFNQLKEYLRSNIDNPDEFLGHLPRFAKILGVKEAALSNYVGANFLNVLTRVKAQMAESSSSTARPPGPDPNDDSGIIQQILTFGSFIVAPSHFESLGMGELKIVTPQGDILARSKTAAPAEPDAGGAGAQGAQVEPVTTSVSEPLAEPIEESTIPRRPEKEIEKSILAEILEKFGSHLDVPHKLTVDPFSGLDKNPPAAEAASPTPVKVGSEAAPAAVTATNTANLAQLGTGPKLDLGPDEPIIADILKKFGSQLDIPHKLEPSDFPAAASAVLDSPVAVAEPQAQANVLVVEVAGNPIQLNFQDYMQLVRRIQEFQKSGNSEGYRAWVNGQAGRSGKAFIGLRNIQQKAGAGGKVDWESEYQKLSGHLDASTVEVSDFHRRIRGFSHLQKLIGNLRGKLVQLSPQVQAALRKIWPQVLLLFNQSQDTHGYMSQLQITMLQISDEAVREQLNLFMRPYFKQLENVYQQIAQPSPP